MFKRIEETIINTGVFYVRPEFRYKIVKGLWFFKRVYSTKVGWNRKYYTLYTELSEAQEVLRSL
jgi:hypothetical protein